MEVGWGLSYQTNNIKQIIDYKINRLLFSIVIISFSIIQTHYLHDNYILIEF